MIFVESMCNGVMFTGSSDRCIKMWDLADPRSAVPCVQSLYGHGGTVLALDYGAQTLLSSSTDGTMLVWRDQSPAKLLRFPAYSVRQKLMPDTSRAAALRTAKESWFLSMTIREAESPSIFAGDSEGYVHIFKPERAQEGERDLIFLLSRKVKIHELGVSMILSVPMEAFLFTLSYDQKLKTLDSLSGQVVFEENNSSNCAFSGLAWDDENQDVVVSDDKGNVGFYNVYTETCVVWRNLTPDPILQVQFQPKIRRLLVLSPHCLRVFDVVRGVKFSELSEHTGPVVGIVARPTAQGGLLYTGAMDNTLRMWDLDALECIRSLKERKTEITAMVYLPRANVLVTGHENSDIKMWSLDSQQEACLRTVSGSSVHSNSISTLIWVGAAAEDLGGQESTNEGGETVVAGSYDGQLSFWKIMQTNDGTAMGKFDRAFLAHEVADDEILAVAHSPVASSIFTGGNRGVVRKWSYDLGKNLEAEYTGHEDAVTCFAVDGHFLFSGSVDCTIRIWETASGIELKTVKVHSVTVQSLLIVPETGMAASCAFDGRLVFWNPCHSSHTDYKVLQTYEQSEEFRVLALAGLNRAVLVGCESGKIVAFPLPSGDTMTAEPAGMFDGIDTPPSTKGNEGLGSLELLDSVQKDPSPSKAGYS